VASFDEVIPPGQAGTIKASVHTTNLRGAVGKGITVNHDDSSQGPIMLSVKFNVVGSVNVLPYPTLNLAPRLKGFKEPALLLIRKEDTESGNLNLTGITASVPWLKITPRKVTTAEPPIEGLPATLPGDYVLAVLVQQAPVGTTSQTVTFKTGLAREPQVTIPVVVTVRPAIVLQPNDLILQPKVDEEGAATGQVLAAVREDLDPKTLTVTTDDKSFVARIEAPGERAFRLTVDWKKNGKKTRTETKIHLAVGGETIDLPVRVNLARVGVPEPAKTH
jgi:hypothetical protein